nr:DUF308 domain-containing protein [uncultured Celeribacter sp.]
MPLSRSFIFIGVLMIVGGALALWNPLVAAIAVTQLVGFFLLLSGAAQLWFASKGAGALVAIAGLLGLVAGVYLIADPLEGVVSLTLVVGLVFIIVGLIRLVLAWGMRMTQMFWLLLFAGAASTFIGVVILGDLGGIATVFLGVILGIELLVDGIGLVAFGIATRHRDH